MDLSKINGREILEFLNQEQGNENLEDISPNGFYFEDQEIRNNRYILSFMSYYNNWGTDQEINDNQIIIDSNGKVSVSLDEPFEGDGSDDVLEELLESFLKTHIFQENVEEDFKKLIQEGQEKLSEIGSFTDKSKLLEVINILKKSLTYIK